MGVNRESIGIGIRETRDYLTPRYNLSYYYTEYQMDGRTSC